MALIAFMVPRSRRFHLPHSSHRHEGKRVISRAKEHAQKSRRPHRLRCFSIMCQLWATDLEHNREMLDESTDAGASLRAHR